MFNTVERYMLIGAFCIAFVRGMIPIAESIAKNFPLVLAFILLPLGAWYLLKKYGKKNVSQQDTLALAYQEKQDGLKLVSEGFKENLATEKETVLSLTDSYKPIPKGSFIIPKTSSAAYSDKPYWLVVVEDETIYLYSTNIVWSFNKLTDTAKTYSVSMKAGSVADLSLQFTASNLSREEEAKIYGFITGEKVSYQELQKIAYKK